MAMAMKLIFCFLAVALLCCLAEAQQQSDLRVSKTRQSPSLPKPPKYPDSQVSSQGPVIAEPAKTKQTQKVPQTSFPTSQHRQNTQKLQRPNQEVFHTCDVDEDQKIQCGAPGISASECEGLNGCFDGRRCYYGKSVTLHCTKDGQFIIVVARDATLPNMDLESITFIRNDPQCAPVATTPYFAIYQFPVTACGTTVVEDQEYSGSFTYQNTLTSSYEVAMGPFGSITRDSFFELEVQCKYMTKGAVALLAEVSKIPAPPPVTVPGPLRVELRLGNGECYTKGCSEELVAYSSFYQDSDYPVSKVLRDNVYVEVRMLERTDPNLVLTLGRCWATSGPDPYTLPQWDLLIDGCPYRDDRYLTRLVPMDSSSGLEYPTHHRRFIFKMFTFVATSQSQGQTSIKQGAEEPAFIPLRETVYIHCDAEVCQNVGNNCEPRCFRKRREIVGSTRKSGRKVTKTASSGMLSISLSSTE